MEKERVFLLIAECESFTKVSKILGISVATISRYVDALEAELNCKILQRSTRSIHLTDQGVAYARGVKKALTILDEAKKSVSGAEHDQVLRDNCIPSVGQHIMIKAINQVPREHPGAKIDLFCDQMVHAATKGEFDLYIRFTEPKDSSMLFKPLAKNQLGLYAGKEYLKKSASIKNPKDIILHNCLSYRFNQNEVWTFEKNSKKWDIPAEGSFRAGGSDLLSLAVHEQMGLALLPTWIPKDEKIVKQVLPSYSVRIKSHKERVIHAIYPKDRRGNKLILSVLEKAKDVVAQKLG